MSEMCDVGTSVPILVFLGLSILELSPMYATDVRQTDVRQKHRLINEYVCDAGRTRGDNSPAGFCTYAPVM